MSRWLPAFGVAAVLLSSCSAVDEVADRASEAITDIASEIASEIGDPPAGNGGDRPDGEDASPSSEDGGPELTPVDDLGRVGANGRAYLRDDRSELVIEVDAQSGVEPGQAALKALADAIKDVSDVDSVRFRGSSTFQSDRTDWTAAELRAVAAAHRSEYSHDDQTVVYVLYVQGGFFEDSSQTNAIGVAHNGSEIAIFPDRWGGLGTLLGGSAGIERAVLVHEFGHLLGLVNLTYTSDVDHEDAEHPGHSNRKGSVMFWAIETTLIGQVFNGPPPDTFDDADRADIAGLKSGKY